MARRTASDICIVEGCGQPCMATKSSKRLYRCQQHQREEWRRLSAITRKPTEVKRGASTKVVQRRPDPTDKTCNVVGCENPRHTASSGMFSRCRFHMADYQRRYREGIEQLPTKPRVRGSKGKTVCVVDGCNNPRRTRTATVTFCRCEQHHKEYINKKYQKWRKAHGKPVRPPKPPVAPKPIAPPIAPPKPVVVVAPPKPAVVVAPPKPKPIAKPVKPSPVVTAPPEPLFEQFKPAKELVREIIRVQIRPFLGGAKNGN